jgi:hypothetical protein
MLINSKNIRKEQIPRKIKYQKYIYKEIEIFNDLDLMRKIIWNVFLKDNTLSL